MEHPGILEHFRMEQGTGRGPEQLEELEHSEGISESWGVGAFHGSGTFRERLELPEASQLHSLSWIPPAEGDFWVHKS